MNTEFLIYITDLFGGELNYSSVTKFRVKAKTERGAVCKVSRYTGLNFRAYITGEEYHSTSKLSGLVIELDNEFPSYDYNTEWTIEL